MDSLINLLSLVLLLGAPQDATFSDQTGASGLIASPAFPAGYNVGPMLAGGAVAADFDADGDQDVFVAMGGVEPDRLFLNDGTGLFTDGAAALGVDALHVGAGVAAGDLDGDGALDLYVVSHGPPLAPVPGAHRCYMNTPGGFVEQASGAGVDTTSPLLPDGFGAGLGDPDRDGDLDLAVAGWKIASLGNRLFRNDGGGQFTDVTATMIVGDLSTLRGFTPLFVDMDGDRWPELLWVSDYGGSRYLTNHDGLLVDETKRSGTGLERNGMGQAVGDFDGDGLLDWFVTAILGPSSHHSGNKLYRALGGHVFAEAATADGVVDGGWGWGAVAVDVDHDGDLDLCENNGWSEIIAAAPPGEWIGEQAYLFVNGGAGTFTDQAVASGIDYDDQGLGLLHFDGDGDGDQDLLFTSNEAPLRYYRNDLSGPDAHWLVVRLDRGASTAVAPHGYGARVTVQSGSAEQVRPLTAGGSYLTQSELAVHVGLGAATSASSVRVDWPDGTTTWLADVAADQELGVTCCHGWKDLGAGMAGAGGTPTLTGQGTLAAGDLASMQLQGGLSGATAWLVLGLSELSVSFKGGTLVPTPDIALPLPLDAAGALDLSGPWPAGIPVATQSWWQAWIPDATGPKGFTATNALRLTTP
jgi:hypothetical protein